MCYMIDPVVLAKFSSRHSRFESRITAYPLQDDADAFSFRQGNMIGGPL